VKNKPVNLAKISTITKIDCLPFTRHQLIIRTSSEYRLGDDSDYFLQRQIMKNCWGKQRKFIWVDYQLGIVRDPHYNYFIVTKLKRLIDRDPNQQLSLF
jgi:hypothetical protein